MSVHIRQVIPGRVLFIRLPGTVSLALLERGFDRLQRLHQGHISVHVVVDLRGVVRLPVNILRVQQAGERYFQQAGSGRTLFLMENWLHRYTVSIIWREYRHRWQVFDSSRQALLFLQSIDATLPEMVLPDEQNGP